MAEVIAKTLSDFYIGRHSSCLAPGRVVCKRVPNCKDGWEYDWESMTDEDFSRFLSYLQSTSKGAPQSRFATSEEYTAFRRRHGRYLALLSKELSSLFKGVDLITPLKARKGSDAEASGVADFDDYPSGVTGTDHVQVDYPEYVREKANNASKSIRRAAQQQFEDVFPIAGTDSLLVGLRRKPPLRLPNHSRVALDSNLLVYLAQEEIPMFRAKAARVLEILQMPLEFVVSESAAIETMNVVLKSGVEISGVPQNGPDAVLRRSRLEAVRRIFGAISLYYFAQAEEGRGSYLNVLRLVSTRRLQTYDARIIVESADPGVGVFITEDCCHGELLPCVKRGVMRNILVWNAMQYAMEVY